MVPTVTDASLYFSFRRGELIGMNGSYVDDLLRAGTQQFKELCQKTHNSFETSGDDNLPLTFAGLTVSNKHEGFLTTDQTFYLQKLKCIESSTFANFVSMPMRFAWLDYTRSDLQFEISHLAQVAELIFEQDAAVHINRLNTIIRYAYGNIAHLPFPKLDLRSIRIVGYSNAAFANNYDAIFQLWRIILLFDDGNVAIPIAFKSYKSGRVTRSVLSAEVIAFADLLTTPLQFALKLSKLFATVYQ